MLKWIVALLLACGSLELFAHYYLGLGDPPLLRTHPTIEYLYAPGQDVRRFGNHFRTNRYGMRSDDFSPRKSRPDELRILVFGDSVVNGGSLTDNARLATTLLQEKLTVQLHRPVIVGNISAGSWGPANQLAYARQFGFLDADVVLLVLSSDDYADAPKFGPLDPDTHPTRKPWSAAWEGFTRYLPRYLSREPREPAAIAPGSPAVPVDPRDIEVSLSAERELLGAAAAAGITTILVQHWNAREVARQTPDEGHDEIRRVAVALGVPCHDDADALRRFQAAGRDPYRDNIHPNDEGQAAFAGVMLEALQSDAAWRLRASAPRPAARARGAAIRSTCSRSCIRTRRAAG